MKPAFFLGPVAALLLAPAAANAQVSSSLTYGDGSDFFDLCSVIGCTETINLNINTPDVQVTVANGFFGNVLTPGLEDLLVPLPQLQLTRTSATQFTLANDVKWFFDGDPDDGVTSATIGFLSGSLFNATQTAGAGSILSSNLTWEFDASKILADVFGGFPSVTNIETASFGLNSSRNSVGATVAAYGVTVQAFTAPPPPPPRTAVPGPFGVVGVFGAFAWARALRRRTRSMA